MKTTVTNFKNVVIEFWLQPYQSREEKPIEELFYYRAYTSIDRDTEITTENDQKWAGDDFLRDSGIVRQIMDAEGWDLNHNWGIVSVIAKEHGQKEDYYTPIKSPSQLQREAEDKKELEVLTKFENNLIAFELTDKEVVFSNESQKFEITVPVRKTPVQISPQIFYDLIQRETNGVNLTLTNSFGEKILELLHGSFLNAGLADIIIYKPGVTQEQIEKSSILNRHELQQGGIFIRKDGHLDVGDIDRSKYLRINIAALIKELHLKGALLDNKKLIEYVKQLRIEAPKNENDEIS